MIGPMALTAEGLRKTLGGNQVLDGVDIALPMGSITALLGRSGSGKTTLLRALSLLELPDAGALQLFGHALQFGVTKDTTPKIWPRLTVVFQDLFLWPHLTCGDNIMMPTVMNDPQNGRARAQEVIATLGLDALIDRRPAEASRGQRQLVAFARGLALDPDILLLDEITASLDVESSGLVGRTLQNLRDRGTSILLITHQLGFARQQADHFLFLEKGRVIESGLAKDLATPRTETVSRYIAFATTAP